MLQGQLVDDYLVTSAASLSKANDPAECIEHLRVRQVLSNTVLTPDKTGLVCTSGL